MKNIILKCFCFFTAFIAMFSLITPVNACTGVIVGGDVSEDGNYIFGRTEDLEINHNKIYSIHPAKTYSKGSKIKDVSYDENLGYEFEFPHDSYKYTSISDTTPEYGIFDEAGFNEKGLIADMTVSASANDAVLGVDPYLDGSDETKNIGITEAIITTVVLSTADNAKDAVGLIADEVAQKGAAEGNGLVVGDTKEIWYMEIYTGHQFVAMKYPRDKFSVFPNTFWINEVTLDKGEEKENYIISKDGNFIYSKGIFETAVKANKFVGDEAKNLIDLAKSYGPEELRESNRSRMCSGILHLNPKANVTLEDDVYPFLQSTDSKITLENVFTFTQNRLENINLEADDLSKDSLYPIGNRNTMEAHIFHTSKDNDATYPGIMWLALGSPLVSPFVAYYPNQEKGIDEAINTSNEYTDNSVYWTAMDILHMVEINRKEFMPIVDKHLKPIQDKFIKNANLSPMSSEESTKVNNSDAKESFETMKKLQAELKELYSDFLKNNSYKSMLKANKKTANLSGSFIEVEADTADTKLNISINTEKNEITLVDNYGNPITSLKKPVKFYINKIGFESDIKQLSDTAIPVKLNGEYYEFESDKTTIGFNNSEEKINVETKKPNSTNKIIIGSLVALAVVLIFRFTKKK